MTEGTSHRFPVRVYWEDTDGAGVVYYANYLKFAERARTEAVRTFGLGQRRLLEEDGLGFVVRHCVADFLAPARLDDLLEVETRIQRVNGASVEVLQHIRREERELVRLRVRLACISADGRPARMPAAVRGGFESFVNSSRRD